MINIDNYINFIDDKYKQLSTKEKKNLINKFAKEIFNELGIQDSLQPKIEFSNNYNESHLGAFVTSNNLLSRLHDLKGNGIIYLSQDVFINCNYSDTNSILNMLYKTLYHESTHCLQNLFLEGKVSSYPNEYDSTFEDLMAGNHLKCKLEIEHRDGDIDYSMGLSYIVGIMNPNDDMVRQTLYFTQPNEWDAFKSDETVISFLESFCEKFKNQNIKQIQKSIDETKNHLIDKQDFIGNTLEMIGYNGYQDINKFRDDVSVIRRALFLQTEKDIKKVKEIENNNPQLYYAFVTDCIKSYQERYSPIKKNDSIELFSSNQNNNIELISQSSALEQAELLMLEEFVKKQLGEPPTEEEINDMMNNQQHTDLENSMEIEEEDFEL